jgi:N-acetylmuramoyl-L-alanine amidase
MNPLRLLVPALLAATLAHGADPTTVKIVTDTSGASTRLVLTFSKKVNYAVVEDTGHVKIVCESAIAADPPSGLPDDAILKSFGTDGDRTIVLSTGRGYGHVETFELKNPPRLVVDLQGTRVSKVAATPAPPPKVLPIIVVDPGHGGVEVGAIGPTGLQEKDVTLDLARRLKAALERQGVTVVLTRDEDRILPLDDRTAIANHNHAILFISLHMNASKRKSAVGAETYYLATAATDAEARTLAGVENKAYEPADSGSQTAQAAQGSAPDHDLELILWDLAQNSYIAESSRLAEAIQKELNAATGVRDRGVRQAPFRVLMGATMPAILVEAGFISNAEEEVRFKDDAYKDKVVDAIAAAVSSITARP